MNKKDFEKLELDDLVDIGNDLHDVSIFTCNQDVEDYVNVLRFHVGSLQEEVEEKAAALEEMEEGISEIRDTLNDAYERINSAKDEAAEAQDRAEQAMACSSSVWDLLATAEEQISSAHSALEDIS